MQGSSDPYRELLDAAALVGHLVPAGSVYAFLAEHRSRLIPDEMFAERFPSSRGRPPQPAELVATVLVLQSLEGKARRAVDSTLLDDAVATQDTVTQLVSMIRRVRNAVPEAAAVELIGDDYDQASGKPTCAWDDPAVRDALVSRLVNDARTVLERYQWCRAR